MHDDDNALESENDNGLCFHLSLAANSHVDRHAGYFLFRSGKRAVLLKVSRCDLPS